MKCRRKVRGMDADGMEAYPPKIFPKRSGMYRNTVRTVITASPAVLERCNRIGRPAAVPASVFLFRKDQT